MIFSQKEQEEIERIRKYWEGTIATKNPKLLFTNGANDTAYLLSLIEKLKTAEDTKPNAEHRLCFEPKECEKIHQTDNDRINDLTAQLSELRDGLRKYGKHQDCDAMCDGNEHHGRHRTDYPCTCGLDVMCGNRGGKQ